MSALYPAAMNDPIRALLRNQPSGPLAALTPQGFLLIELKMTIKAFEGPKMKNCLLTKAIRAQTALQSRSCLSI